jgi:hypothetical protein
MIFYVFFKFFQLTISNSLDKYHLCQDHFLTHPKRSTFHIVKGFLVPHPVESFPLSVIVLLRMVLIVVLDVDSLDTRCFEQSITPIVSMS